MKHAKIITLIVMLAILSGVVGAAWALTNSRANDSSTNQPTSKMSLPEQIRDEAIAYVATSHPETEQFMNNLTWTGGAVETLAPPATYIFNSQGWTVMIQEPIKGTQTYTINAEYNTSNIGIPYNIAWAGTWENGTTGETSYSFCQ